MILPLLCTYLCIIRWVKLNRRFQFSFPLIFFVVIFVPIIFFNYFVLDLLEASVSGKQSHCSPRKQTNKQKIWLQNSEMVTVTGRSWNISIVTRAKVRKDGGIRVYFLKGQFFFSSPKRQIWLWVPHSFLFHG